MNNLLIAIAVFVITVVGALFAVPHFIDWNSYRGIFEREARNVIGREVRVDGDIELHLLPTPYFRLEKVRIADVSANLTGQFFKAESLSIKLSITPLFRGIVEAHEIEFHRPVLRLAPDAKGRWNWQSFAEALQAAGYVPANVALTSLRIRDGVLALHGSDGVENARLEGLNGELSAPALQGPYSFRGEFGRVGARREIRLGTSVPEADGTVPVRASLRLPDTGASYVLNGRVADLMGRTRVKGDVSVKLPIPGSPLQHDSDAPLVADSPEEKLLSSGREAVELKGAIEADAGGARLSDLTLTFGRGGRPQTVTGDVRAGWRKALALEMNLSSKWLDLDRMVGATDGFGPVDSIGKFAALLRELLPADGGARARIAIDQAKLGGERIGPVRLRLAQAADTLKIEELRVGLPGASRAVLTGDITGPAKAPVFKGSLGLRGASAARFLAWATAGKVSPAAKSDGAFDIRAELTLDAAQAAASDLVGRLAGTMLRGNVRYRWAGRPQLALALEGPKLDVRGLLPEGASLFQAFDRLASMPFARQGGERGSPAATAGLDLRVKVGQLITDARTYRDVSAAVQMKGGDLKQLRLRLSGDDGYSLELEGRVDNVASRPEGSLRGYAAAETAAGIAVLGELLGVPVAFRPKDGREQAMVPLRLAGTMTLGRRTATAADLVIDGEANGAAVRVSARFDGGPGGWRTGRADLTASIESADAAKVASLLFARDAPSGRTDSAKPGRMLLRANGVPSEGLASVASIEAGDVGLNFRGRLRVDEAGAKAEGDLEVRADNGTSLAALAGLAPPLSADGVPVGARLRLSLDGSTISIDKLALQVGGSRLSGRIKLSDAGDRRRIDADLHTDEVSVAGLLRPLLDSQLAVAGAAEALLQGRQSPWPGEPFSRAAFDAFEGQIRLSCKRLTVAEGIALDRAKFNVVLRPGKVDVKEIAGAGLGGQFKASFSIEKAAAGADVRGTLDFGIALDAFPSGSPPRAKGQMHGTIAFSGRGLSPRAVMSALHGKGSVRFGEAELAGLWPGAIAAAAGAALKADAGKLATTVREGLAAGLATGSLSLKPGSLALEMVDGQLRSKPLVVETTDGRATGTARINLKALTIESQWRLEARPPDAVSKPLPAVTVSYRGPIVSLGALDPEIDATALEQELSARRIERDMKELERLRRLEQQRLEEQRRAEEAERLRKELERAARRRLEEEERLRKELERATPSPPPPPILEVPITPSNRGPQPARPG